MADETQRECEARLTSYRRNNKGKGMDVDIIGHMYHWELWLARLAVLLDTGLSCNRRRLNLVGFKANVLL